MNYTKTLELAKQVNIDIYKLTIANEVSDLLEEKEIKDMDFERICEYIGALYLDFDCSMSLSTVVNGVLTELEHGDLTFAMIEAGEDQTEDYNIKDVICQCY